MTDDLHNGELEDFPKTWHVEEEEIECVGCGDFFYTSGGKWVHALGSGYFIPDTSLCKQCKKENEEDENI